MTHSEDYHSGILHGAKYQFDEVGDCIPEHAHRHELLHNIIVLRGSVEVRFSDGEGQRLAAGCVFDFDGTRPHAIVATAPNSRILNLLLNGAPGWASG